MNVHSKFDCPRNTVTHTRQSNTAVTALGRGGKLFDVVVDKPATRGLYDAPLVRSSVVRVALAERDALSHGEPSSGNNE
jgi:hypothetical protein